MLSGLMVGQIGGSAEGLSATAGGSGRLEHKGGCAPAPKHWRLRLPGNALIDFEVRLGLLEEIPVRHRRGSIVPGGWVSCAEAANDRTRMVRAGTQAEQDSAAQGRAGVISGGRGGSPMCVRIRSTGAASVMNAIRRMSAPQLGQVRGCDSNNRSLIPSGSMTQR